MAQIKRKKVSNKAVKGQKKENGLLKNKKFWIIVSSVVAAAAIITFVVWLIIHLTSSSSKTNPDYFGGKSDLKMSSEKTNNTEVKFTKCSYEGVVMHTNLEGNTNETYIDYLFVFATDLSTFYADATMNSGLETTDENYITTSTIDDYNKLFYQFVYLQYEIDQFNKTSSEKAALYIVDTSVDDNLSIFADSNFGGSDDSTNSSLFFLYELDGLRKYADKKADSTEKGNKLIYSTKNTEIAQTSINNSVNLMKKNFVVE